MRPCDHSGCNGCELQVWKAISLFHGSRHAARNIDFGFSLQEALFIVGGGGNRPAPPRSGSGAQRAPCRFF